MSARTDINTVKGVIDTGLSDSELLLLIAQANRIVTRQLSGQSMTTALLTDIETWLTAHLIAIGKERQLFSEKVGDMWLTAQGKFDAGLKMTTYGQMVLMLDSSGLLSRASKSKVIIKAISQTIGGTNIEDL